MTLPREYWCVVYANPARRTGQDLGLCQWLDPGALDRHIREKRFRRRDRQYRPLYRIRVRERAAKGAA